MYAGVPTVDFGCECNKPDWSNDKKGHDQESKDKIAPNEKKNVIYNLRITKITNLETWASASI